LTNVANGIVEDFDLSWDPVAVACVLINSYFAMNIITACWRTARMYVGGKAFFSAMQLCNVALVLLVGFGPFSRGVIYWITSSGDYHLTKTTDGIMVIVSAGGSAVMAYLAKLCEMQESGETDEDDEENGVQFGANLSEDQLARNTRRCYRGKVRLVVSPAIWIGMGGAICLLIAGVQYSTDVTVGLSYVPATNGLTNGTQLSNIGSTSGPGGFVNDLTALVGAIQSALPLLTNGTINATLAGTAMGSVLSKELNAVVGSYAQCRNDTFGIQTAGDCDFIAGSTNAANCAFWLTVGRAFNINNRRYTNPFSSTKWIVWIMFGIVIGAWMLTSISVVYGRMVLFTQSIVKSLSVFLILFMIKTFQLEWTVENVMSDLSVDISVPALVTTGVLLSLLSIAMIYATVWATESTDEMKTRVGSRASRSGKEMSKLVPKPEFGSNLRQRVYESWEKILLFARKDEDNDMTATDTIIKAEARLAKVKSADDRELLDMLAEAENIRRGKSTPRIEALADVDSILEGGRNANGTVLTQDERETLVAIRNILTAEVSQRTVDAVVDKIKKINKGS